MIIEKKLGKKKSRNRSHRSNNWDYTTGLTFVDGKKQGQNSIGKNNSSGQTPNDLQAVNGMKFVKRYHEDNKSRHYSRVKGIDCRM